MTNKCKSHIVYIDHLKKSHASQESAERANHEISLQFRKYIQEELLIAFKNGGVDELQTTLNIWQMLDFTPECIARISHIMSKEGQSSLL